MDSLFRVECLTEGRFQSGLLKLTEGRFWVGASEGTLIYRGQGNPIDIDYDIVVASMFGWTGDISVIYTHTEDSTYYYAARHVSKYGRIDQNNDVFVSVIISGSDIITNRPNRVRGLTAVAAVGGTVKITWTHIKGNGTKPVSFEIYYDQGNGASTIDTSDPACKLSSETATSRRTQSCTTTALTDGQLYYFAVQAKDTDGNESIYSTVVMAVADSTLPDAVTGITSATRL